MVHTVRRYKFNAVGSSISELQVLDISALDSAGTETGVSTLKVKLVEQFVGFVRDGNGEFITWDGSDDELKILNETGSRKANNATINGVYCTWQGPR